jgi:arylsulfatase
MQAADYPNYAVDKLWTVMPIQAVVEQHLATFREFPRRQKSGDFNMDEIIKSVMRAAERTRGGN